MCLPAISNKTSTQRRPVTTMNKGKVVLNIGGERFVTFSSNFYRYPGTRLYELSKDDPAYDTVNDEYFFDRNSKIFHHILDFYRTGDLHFPQCLCGPLIKKELAFWNIPDENIAACCWRHYREFDEEEDTLNEIENTFRKYAKTACSEDTEVLNSRETTRNVTWKTWGTLSRKIYLFLEDPRSSLAAKVWSYVYLVVLLLSISIVCLETHPSFRVASTSLPNINLTAVNNPKLLLHLTTEPHIALVIVDSCCSFIFIVEVIARFIVWPVKRTFFTTFFNVVDLFAILPYFIYSMIQISEPRYWTEHKIKVAFIIMAISSVFRSIRILKLVKHNRGLQVIYLAIKSSIREILLLLVLVFIGTLVFSTGIYFAELSDPDTFENIPIGFWWVIVTMTTVGYGDKVPKTAIGYMIGSCCALSGMLVTGLPIPVIANSFHLYYTYAKTHDTKDGHQEKSPISMASSDPLCGTSTRMATQRRKTRRATVAV